MRPKNPMPPLAVMLLGWSAPAPASPPPPSPDPLAVDAVQLLAPASSRTGSPYFGISVAGVGDANGDGFDDFVVGASFDDENAQDAGAVFVYLGDGASVNEIPDQKLMASEPERMAYLGAAAAAAGDIDGDGRDDLVAGAWEADGEGESLGAAFLWLGAASGFDQASEVRLSASDGQTGAAYAWSVDGAGDLDGDGHDDVIVGAYGHDLFTGAAYVYHGSSTGIDGDDERQLLASDGQRGDRFGRAVAGAGDLDADGYADVIVGAYGRDDSAGAVCLYHGGSGGLDPHGALVVTASDGESGDRFGFAVASAGDIDGDGHADVVVGAPLDDDMAANAGAAYLYLGATTGLDTATESKLVADDKEAGGLFGNSVSGVGDVDGDGFFDLLVGAYAADDGEANSGVAHVFLGSSAGVESSSMYKQSSPEPDGWGYFGYAVGAAGDLDSDGRSELLVGSPAWEIDGDPVGAAWVFDYDWPPIAWYPDDDGDGFGDEAPATVIKRETQPSGYVSDGTDCDDEDAAIHPGAEEVCGDGVDSDCDGHGGPGDDEDADGLSWSEEQALGTDDCDADSDDDGVSDGDEVGAGTDPSEPDAGTDTASDSAVDTGIPERQPQWHRGQRGCGGCTGGGSAPAAWWLTWLAALGVFSRRRSGAALWLAASALSSGCFDKEDSGSPAPGPDNVDAGEDEDGDGFSVEGGDCDDSDANVHPGALEHCDGIDEDCDGSVDEDPVDGSDWFEDADGDGFGNIDLAAVACEQPSGHVADGTDCDDEHANAYPGASEIIDGIDNDCDGLLDCEDGDCAGVCTEAGACDDGDDNDLDGWTDCEDDDCWDSCASDGVKLRVISGSMRVANRVQERRHWFTWGGVDLHTDESWTALRTVWAQSVKGVLARPADTTGAASTAMVVCEWSVDRATISWYQLGGRSGHAYDLWIQQNRSGFTIEPACATFGTSVFPGGDYFPESHVALPEGDRVPMVYWWWDDDEPVVGYYTWYQGVIQAETYRTYRYVVGNPSPKLFYSWNGHSYDTWFSTFEVELGQGDYYPRAGWR